MSQIFYREEKRPKLSLLYHIWHIINFSFNLFTWHIKSAYVTNGDRRHYKKGSSFWRHLCLWHQLFIFTYLVKPLIKVTVWPLHRRTLHQQSSVILTLLVRTCYQFTSLVIGLVNSWAAQWSRPIPIWHEYTLRSCWHSPPSWTVEKFWLRHEYFMLWAILFESHK